MSEKETSPWKKLGTGTARNKKKLTSDATSPNGLSPLLSSRSTSPAPQTSLDLVYVPPLSRSGLMYLVVPTTVRFMTVSSSGTSGRAEDIPKSASLTPPDDETRTLAGLFFSFLRHGRFAGEKGKKIA